MLPARSRSARAALDVSDAEAVRGTSERRSTSSTIAAAYTPEDDGEASANLAAVRAANVDAVAHDAGMHSDKDPKYTVIPRRERIAARENGHVPTVSR